MTSAVTVLEQGEVHVWRIQLTSDRWTEATAARLSEDERQQAGRLRFEHDRRAFTRRRAALRSILAGYVGVEPGRLSLRRSPLGRPYLEPSEGLDFSCSSRGPVALVAVGRGLGVGVDLEEAAVDLPYRQLGEFVLDAESQRAIESADDPRRAFLQAFTALEARAKLAGVGLAEAVRRRSEPSSLALDACLSRLEVGPGFVACLATSGPPTAVRMVEHAGSGVADGPFASGLVGGGAGLT